MPPTEQRAKIKSVQERINLEQDEELIPLGCAFLSSVPRRKQFLTYGEVVDRTSNTKWKIWKGFMFQYLFMLTMWWANMKHPNPIKSS